MTKEIEDLYNGVVKFKEEYDEFNTFDNEMALITLFTIGISRKLYTNPDDQKLLDDSAKILFTIMKGKDE